MPNPWGFYAINILDNFPSVMCRTQGAVSCVTTVRGGIAARKPVIT